MRNLIYSVEVVSYFRASPSQAQRSGHHPASHHCVRTRPFLHWLNEFCMDDISSHSFKISILLTLYRSVTLRLYESIKNLKVFKKKKKKSHNPKNINLHKDLYFFFLINAAYNHMKPTFTKRVSPFQVFKSLFFFYCGH